MNPTSEEKNQLRVEMRGRLKPRDVALMPGLSLSALRLLENEDAWRQARSILGFSAIGYELDLWPALAKARKEGKTAALPRYDPATLTYGAAEIPNEPGELARAGFGILEPNVQAPAVPLNRLDFILVPGLAFDLNGRRLGRGKGFYDRLLAQVTGLKCGVALDEQIVEAIPAEPHDIAMNFILTPTRWLVVPPVRT